MNGATEILRSYVRLVGRLSGAVSVSFYVPPGSEGEREILIHDGRLAPVTELLDAESAAEFNRQRSSEPSAGGDGALRLASRTPDGILFRIPLHWVRLPSGEAPGLDRRRCVAPHGAEVAAWIGLRFGEQTAELSADDIRSFPMADALLDEGWWKGFLGLAAAFAANARTLAGTVFDAITGLPDRLRFQADVEAALAHAEKSRFPALLLLLGPDDFGWVNDRLGRRAGDQVLREIATALTEEIRSHDNVSRYGGAVLAVILLDTPLEDGRNVAEKLVGRLSDQRYYRDIVRLEFSAGVAVADPEERVDAQELIRRADQALSAAKRGGVAGVRVWERGSDVELAGSVDRLQGIFTGDKFRDYRNMRLLLDAVAVVAASADASELASNFTARLFEALHARRVGVFERGVPGGYTLLGGIERAGGGTQAFHATERDLAIVEQACREQNLVAQGGGQPGDLFLCAVPLFLQSRCLGAIVLEATSLYISLAGSDLKFMEALASEMAVALDRVRLIERERERQQAERARLEAEVADLRRVVHGSRFAYRSPVMEALLATARKVARTDTTVLITGESGTGKELLAQIIHELSARHDRPLVVVDCSVIAPTLIESELFGHERGAFTGAHARKPGRLAQADGATVFLDEIGDLPLDLQSKLLRFVQQKQFTPVGSVVARTVDARIIAATNSELRTKVAEGKFREDLFHRLNVVRLHVPPLRERREDILHLATVFLKQLAALYRRPALRFTARAEKALESHDWPGNVRELQNLVLTSALFCDSAEVDVADLQGFQVAVAAPSAATAVLPSPLAPPPGASGATSPPDPALRLRSALAGILPAAIVSGPAAVPPIGKWLAEDLVLTADRLSGGVLRRGAELLGLPETTYRRQLRNAGRHRATGQAVRSPWWPTVVNTLDAVVLGQPTGTNTCQWAEACLLAEIESAAPGDARTATALLGITELTLLRRRAQRSRHS